MESASNCPKCQSVMEKGYTVEWHGKYALSDKWYPGVPEESDFFGLKTGMFKVDLERAHPTTTYRCTNCGYLEFYCK
jgi:predicted nucleic-acid-binding Zn-ribbon protein